MEKSNQLEKTEAILLELDDGAGILSMWIDLANTYEQRSSKAKAIYCTEIAKDMATRLENMDVLMNIEYKLGLLYYEQQKWNIALDHFRNSQRMASQQNNSEMQTLTKQYLSFLAEK